MKSVSFLKIFPSNISKITEKASVLSLFTGEQGLLHPVRGRTFSLNVRFGRLNFILQFLNAIDKEKVIICSNY